MRNLRLDCTPLALALFALALTSAAGQTPATRQIVRPIDESALTTIKGSTHPLAQARYDRGPVPDSTPAKRLLLVLNRPPASEAALRQRIADLHDSASPSFHHWLTPAVVGANYGPADEDVATVSTWLGGHGFSIDRVHPGKTVIEFSGNTGQIRSAFHTEIHRYTVNGEDHLANNANLQIPDALTTAIAGIASLNDFHGQPNLVTRGTAVYTPSTHAVQPLWTYPINTAGNVYLALAPGDFNVQYDVPSSTYTGSGVTIGIIGASNVDVGLVNSYRSVFGLPANQTQVVVDGEDPGQNGAATESYLDVEAAGSVAPGATVVLYTSASSALTDGLFTAAIRAVNDDTADVLSMSYGECESVLGTSTDLFFYDLWQQAAAQGQTVMVSAGDGGAAGCDNFDSEEYATQGLAVSGFASTPYNVAVGGTDFYYSDYNAGSTLLDNQIFSYWTGTSSKTPVTSMLKTIPEQPWNVPFGLDADSGDGLGIVAGSGGVSVEWSKPTWQSASGVPADGHRDLPDVSLFASSGSNYSFWAICAVNTDCTTTSSSTGAVNITGVGGTSASSPAFAGVMALVNQATKSRQGQANYVLYPLAAQVPAAFHDVTAGSNIVPCEYGTFGCGYALVNGSYAYAFGYSAATGYDLASGLGSVDVAKLIANWNSVQFKSTATALTLGSTSITHGQSVTVKASVAPSSGTGTPTGSVALVSKVSGATAQTGLGDLALTSGAASTTVSTLPGGTYTVYADYSGDSTYAASQSTGSAITVSPETSVISYPAVELNAYNNQTLQYGESLYLLAQVAGTSGYGTPTGLVTITDSVSGSQTLPLNAEGYAEWNTPALALGTHTVTSTYAGDASFKASTTPATMTFTVGKGTPEVSIVPATTVLQPGQSLTVLVNVLSRYATGNAPTGTVTLTLGTQTQTATLAASGVASSSGTVTFSSVPAGYYYVYGTYNGDTNWVAAPAASQNEVEVFSGTTYYPTVTTLTAASPSVNGADAELVVTGTVAGSEGAAPGGIVAIYSNGILVYETFLTAVSGSSTTSAYSAVIPADEFANGTASLVANYLGNYPYSASTSSALSVAANVGDFAINSATSSVSIPSGNSAVANLTLTSSGLSGTVAITCATSSASIVCSPPSSSPTLASLGQTTTSVTIYASNVADATPLALPFPSASEESRAWIAVAGFLLLAIPARRRIRPVLFAVLLLAASGLMSSCGGSGSSGGAGSGNTPVTPVNAPQATYSVTVTATSGTTTHDLRLTVNVQ